MQNSSEDPGRIRPLVDQGVGDANFVMRTSRGAGTLSVWRSRGAFRGSVVRKSSHAQGKATSQHKDAVKGRSFAGRDPLPTHDAGSSALESVIKRIGVSKRFRKNTEVYAENEPAEYFCKVISGAVRSYKILSDGRRPVGAFYFPGDIFGLGVGATHSQSAEAVVDSDILLINRDSLVKLAATDNRILGELWKMTAAELRRIQEHGIVFVMSAQDRVVSFLLEVAEREAATSEVELPMSRSDIANYLGLTIETVSRTFKQLEQSAAIALPTFHRVVLHECAAPC